MDIVRLLPESRSDHPSGDYATRFLETFPLCTITAPAVMRTLIQLFSEAGIPDEILTDQGTNFTSWLMKLFQKQLGNQGNSIPSTDQRFGGTVQPNPEENGPEVCE